MRVEYSKRAIADLRKIAEYHLQSNDAEVAAALEQRIRATVVRITRSPASTPRVAQRPDIRVAFLLRYRYKIFYRVTGDTIRIVHIRHTARRPVGSIKQQDVERNQSA
jgi:toxin ParE1/3/4